jgi:hypothetical protein
MTADHRNVQLTKMGLPADPELFRAATSGHYH